MKLSKRQWKEEVQHFETSWWDDCTNTFLEETKQFKYAEFMGLKPYMSQNGRKVIDIQGKSILDIGGGPVSLLLKTVNRNYSVVLEPMKMTGWVLHRYLKANINISTQPAEEFTSNGVFDEIWIYNVLQHTMNPKLILEKARKYSKLIRIFEWLDTPAHKGHPQTLRQEELDKWLGGKGRAKVFDKNEWGGYGKAYYGVFPTENYEGKRDN